MYVSDAGGCCDCGDPASWREAGCCPRHRPEEHPAAPEATLPPSAEAALAATLALACARLCVATWGALLLCL
jgi:hypothetical protein